MRPLKDTLQPDTCVSDAGVSAGIDKKPICPASLANKYIYFSEIYTFPQSSIHYYKIIAILTV